MLAKVRAPGTIRAGESSSSGAAVVAPEVGSSSNSSSNSNSNDNNNNNNEETVQFNEFGGDDWNMRPRRPATWIVVDEAAQFVERAAQFGTFPVPVGSVRLLIGFFFNGINEFGKGYSIKKAHHGGSVYI